MKKRLVAVLVVVIASVGAGWSWTDDARAQWGDGGPDGPACHSWEAWVTTNDANGNRMVCEPDGNSPTGYSWVYA
jgi:hypothetical protein